MSQYVKFDNTDHTEDNRCVLKASDGIYDSTLEVLKSAGFTVTTNRLLCDGCPQPSEMTPCVQPAFPSEQRVWLNQPPIPPVQSQTHSHGERRTKRGNLSGQMHDPRTHVIFVGSDGGIRTSRRSIVK